MYFVCRHRHVPPCDQKGVTVELTLFRWVRLWEWVSDDELEREFEGLGFGFALMRMISCGDSPLLTVFLSARRQGVFHRLSIVVPQHDPHNIHYLKLIPSKPAVNLPLLTTIYMK